MGFYIRKSVRLGPIRFNLSKSGIGVSAGVKGFRVGSGPRGNYVHMGVGGLYYRQTLPSLTQTISPANVPSISPRQIRLPESATLGPLVEIESADVSKMTDMSSSELLTEMNSKYSRTQYWPLLAALFVFGCGIALASNVPGWFVIGSILCGVGLTTYVARRDAIAKTVVLCYNFDSNAEAAYQQVHDSFQNLSGCARIWHIEATAQVLDRKYHAGAHSLSKRSSITLCRRLPPFVRANIVVPAIPAGRQTLYFFPDRLLVYSNTGVGAVPYSTLTMEITQTNFVEDGQAPADARVIGRTWQYVNKSGGPDRRFKNNEELPICQYEELVLDSPTGLHIVLQLSKLDFAAIFVDSIHALSKIVANGSSGTKCKVKRD